MCLDPLSVSFLPSRSLWLNISLAYAAGEENWDGAAWCVDNAAATTHQPILSPPSSSPRFLGVARLQDRAIVASHAYNTVIDLNGVKEVLKSDQLSVRPGVHFSFASGGSAWHLMSDVEGRIFILISERAYPVRAAHACLEEFQRSVRGVREGVCVCVCVQGGLCVSFPYFMSHASSVSFVDALLPRIHTFLPPLPSPPIVSGQDGDQELGSEGEGPRQELRGDAAEAVREVRQPAGGG